MSGRPIVRPTDCAVIMRRTLIKAMTAVQVHPVRAADVMEPGTVLGDVPAKHQGHLATEV